MEKRIQRVARSGVNNGEFNLSHTVSASFRTLDFHAHSEYEIFYFLKGQVQYYIEERSYYLMPGDVLVIPPGKMHRPVVIEENTTYERMVLMVAPQYGRHLLARARESFVWRDLPPCRITMDQAEGAELRQTMDRLLGLKPTERGLLERDCRCTILLMQLDRLIAGSTGGEDGPRLRMQQVIHYINAHFTEELSLEDVAARFYLSKYYLLRQFKVYTNMTVHSYILAKRILLAKALLKEGMPSQEVAAACGFGSYGSFYQAFVRQTGVSPTRIREQE